MITENTVGGWTSVIADLTAKRQQALQHLAQLRAEKKALALDAAMGDEDAKKRLSKTNTELNRLALEIDDFDIALQNAQGEKQKAEDQAAMETEQKRQEELRDAVCQYFEEVKAIDAALQTLAKSFATAKEALDRAESFMNSQERVPTAQLRSMFGATLAAAHYGLGDFIHLGPSAGHVIHRKPLADYTYGFVDRWTDNPPSASSDVKSNGRE